MNLKKLNFFLGGVFFCSGVSSLIYQVVWQRLLTLYYGVGILSVTLIVSVFMLGLGFGALAGGALAERIKNRIGFYVFLELALGLFGIASPAYLDFLGRHTASSLYGVSFVCMFLFLSLPTLFMGMTFPVMVKIFNRAVHHFGSSVSFLYFINTLGAAFGALLASYGIISFFGLDSAVKFAALVNFVLAGLIFCMARQGAGPEKARDSLSGPTVESKGTMGRAAYLWLLVTGFLGIGYEIIGCRIVEVLVKASPYAFSSVLFVYLCGIAFGSRAVNRHMKKKPSPDLKKTFFCLQGLIGIYVLLSVAVYYQLTCHTHFRVFTENSFWQVLHPPDRFPGTGSWRSDLFVTLDIFLWPLFFFFVPALAMGASFPLVARLALLPDKEGGTAGTAYFFLSAGNVLGGLITGLLILPFLGTERALWAFGAAGVIMGMIPFLHRSIYALVFMGLLFPFFPRRGELYRAMHVSPGISYNAHLEEGREGVVMTYESGVRVINYINGLGHGRRPGYEFYKEAVETVRFAPKAEQVLVLGFGTGSLVEAISKLDEAKSITLVELNGVLMKNLQKMGIFREILSDPRIRVVMDDARRFLARTEQRFDLILMDPLRTTTAYSNNLYSRQFFEQAKRALESGGIFMVWTDEYRVMPKTVASVFPHLRFYDSFILASGRPFKENQARASRFLANFSEATREGMERKGQYLGNEIFVENETRGLPVNEDLVPVCEYYLGLKARGVRR